MAGRSMSPGARNENSAASPPDSSSSGVLSATTRPLSMMTMRSANASTSARSCVVSITVTPSVASDRIRSRMSWRPDDVDAGRGFVEEHDVGTADDREGQAEALLLAARQRAPGRTSPVLEPDEVEQRLGVAGPVVVAGVEAHRLDGPDARVDAARLEHHAHPAVELGTVGAGIEAAHAHRSPMSDGGIPRGTRWSRSCRRRSGPGPR